MRAAYILWATLWGLHALRCTISTEHQGVYPIFATASQHWWQGVPMYAWYEGLDIFRYSPTFAVLFSAFGLLPCPLGPALWNLVSLATLFVALRTFVQRVLPTEWSTRTEGIFLVMTLAGTFRGVWSAQSNALLLALALFGVVAIVERRWWWASLCLSLPVFIKIWPIALVLLLCFFWPRQLAPRVLASSALLAFVPFLTRSWPEVIEEYRGFTSILFETSELRWRGYRDAWTIFEAFGEVNPRFYLILQALTSLAVLGWCVWMRRRAESEAAHLTFIIALWSAWQLLFGPGTERLSYGLIAPFASITVLVSSQNRLLRFVSLAAWSMTSILGTGRVERALLPHFPAATAILPLGVVAFVVWLILRERATSEDLVA